MNFTFVVLSLPISLGKNWVKKCDRMIGEDDRIEIIRAHRNITSLTFLDFPL